MKTKRYKNSGIKLSMPVIAFFGIFGVILLMQGELWPLLVTLFWLGVILTGCRVVWTWLRRKSSAPEPSNEKKGRRAAKDD